VDVPAQKVHAAAPCALAADHGDVAASTSRPNLFASAAEAL
jgi:hypothetical protein